MVPGAAERIIVMAEEQSGHRREMERIVIRSNSRDALLGWISASIISLLAVGGGVFLIYHDKDAAGLTTIIVDLIGLVSVFIYSKHREMAELSEKKEEGA